MKRLIGLVLGASLLASLGGCVYGPGYYQRPGVVYDNGNGAVDAQDSRYDYAYGPGYYPGYAAGYFDPWCCYGYGPFIGLGFYDFYGFHGGYHGRGPFRGGAHGMVHGGGGGHSGGFHGH